MDRIAVVQVDPAAARPVMPSGCASGGCDGPVARPAPPPAFAEVWVNGVEIAPEAIAEEIQHHPGATPEAAWTAAARALAVRELLLQEARRRPLDWEPATLAAGRRETDEEALIGALLDAALEAAAPTPAECRRYYDSHQQRFRTPELFEASHILIEPEGSDAAGWQAAAARARLIAAEVGDDPAAFAAAAREFSRCPTAHQDGSLGQVRRGELEAPVQRALEALAAGTAGREPVRSSHGWHVVRLERRIDGQTLPFEAVSERIADMLEARAWSVAAARYVASLANTAEVEGIVIVPDEAGGCDGTDAG